jgi:hypothetical protein
MLPIFLGVAIIGGCVGIFFLRAKRKRVAHPDPASPGSHNRASSRIARIGKTGKMSALTEEPKALCTGTFNKEKTGAKRNQLEQIKKLTTVK